MSVSFTGVVPKAFRNPPYLAVVCDSEPTVFPVTVAHTLFLLPPVRENDVRLGSHASVLRACQHEIDVFLGGMGEFNPFRSHSIVKIAFPKGHDTVSDTRILLKGIYPSNLSPQRTLFDIKETCENDRYVLTEHLAMAGWSFKGSVYGAYLPASVRDTNWLKPQLARSTLAVTFVDVMP